LDNRSDIYRFDILYNSTLMFIQYKLKSKSKGNVLNHPSQGPITVFNKISHSSKTSEDKLLAFKFMDLEDAFMQRNLHSGYTY